MYFPKSSRNHIFFFSAIFLLWHYALTPYVASFYYKVIKEISAERPPLLIGSLPLSMGRQSTKDDLWLISCSQRSLNEPSLLSPCSAKAQTTQQEQHFPLCTHFKELSWLHFSKKKFYRPSRTHVLN